MRTRRRATPMRLAIRCESSGPRPGENQARTGTPPTSTGGTSNPPLPSTRPRVHRSSKFRAYARAIASDATVTSTFSSRVHESSVQFVEPLHTAAPSRTTYLWCMRSGSPGIARNGTPSVSSSDGSVRGGGGSGLTARSPSSLKAMRTVTPRAAAARIASATASPTGPGRRTS